VEYLGKEVECQHCHARFEAFEPGSAEFLAADSGLSLLERAEQLLQSASLSMPAMSGVETDVLPMRPK
jgi:hypothetical protein